MPDLERGLLPAATTRRRTSSLKIATKLVGTDTLASDSFTLQYELDLAILCMLFVIDSVSDVWTVTSQLNNSSSGSFPVALMFFSISQTFSFGLGLRICLQMAVHRRSLSSESARLILVAGLLIFSNISDLLYALNFGFPRFPGPGEKVAPMPDMFLFYFILFTHVMEGRPRQVIARLMAIFFCGAGTSETNWAVYANLASNRTAFYGFTDVPFDMAFTWTQRVEVWICVLIFGNVIKKYWRALADLQEYKAARGFSAIMFHELRNPLNGTVGHLALAQLAFQESAMPAPASVLGTTTIAPTASAAPPAARGGTAGPRSIEAARMSIRDALTCTDHALKVLHTLNSLQKFSREGWPVAARLTDLPVLCSEVETMARPSVDPGVELRHELVCRPSSLAPVVLIDDLMAREVLLNLVQNSARFTTTGSIEFGCEVSLALPSSKVLTDEGTQVPERCRCCFYVRDTGTGIHEAALQTLFTQVASVGGIGIGVHLSQRQVEAMGGELRVRSPWAVRPARLPNPARSVCLPAHRPPRDPPCNRLMAGQAPSSRLSWSSTLAAGGAVWPPQPRRHPRTRRVPPPPHRHSSRTFVCSSPTTPR
jgi:signal transduction histidine kinase